MTMWRAFGLRFGLVSVMVMGALAVGCSDPEVVDGEGEPDAEVGEPDGGDVGGEGDVDAGEEELERAEIDVEAVLEAPGEGFVRAVQVQSAEEGIVGEVAQGVAGDWVLENDFGRYQIGFGERVVGPCSWDGNPIAVSRADEGAESVLGEICFLLNIGQTFRPEVVEVLEDGSEGRAVVAVTGRPVPLDFLNVSSMVDDFAPGLLDALDFDPVRELPLTVTVYYALTPQSRSLRVITAMRNDGGAAEYVVAAHLVLSGSTGSYFNPFGGPKGWGYRMLGSDNLNADPVSYLGYFNRRGGYAVVPDAWEYLERDGMPVGAGMLAVSGAAGLIHGATDLLQTLTAPRSRWPQTRGYQAIEPGAVSFVGYRLYPGAGAVSSVTDAIYEDMALGASEVSGRVVDAQGEGVSGVKVSALRDGDRAFVAGWTDAQGGFAFDLLEGSWELRFRDDGVLTRVSDVEVGGEDVALGEVALSEPGVMAIQVRDAAGEPVPARVVIACVNDCGDRREDSRERDAGLAPPYGWLRIEELGVGGQATLKMAPGEYRVSVNRGMTWSVWPSDATLTGGEPVSVVAGEEVVVEAEIAEVIDTSGALSADFHIHAMYSPDSNVSEEQRVLDFMAGGLDVMVSSDHDAISDFGAAIVRLGAQAQIASVVGSEITTSNLGHINAFPLQRDAQARRGGPLDWSNDGGLHLTLQEVVDRTREHPGEQVIQLNHPKKPMGAIGLLEADVITGQSFADPAARRMTDAFVDEVSGDTGLWTDDFDAIEVLNGFSEGDFWSSMRWWLAMVGRGFSPTATAVSDTHGVYGSLAASPRSFVMVDQGRDSAQTMSIEHLVERIKEGALVGTTGPFMQVEAVNGAQESAGPGDVLDAASGTVTLRVTLQLTDWVDVDRLDLYMNVPAEGLVGAPGEAVEEALAPTRQVDVVWDEASHRELVAQGARAHYRWRQEVEVELEVERDSYVVVIARGANGRTMVPVLASSVKPMAFSNPVFLDADGGGYDNPPLASYRQELLEARASGEAVGQRRGALVAPVIRPGEEVRAEHFTGLINALSCGHGGEEATHVHGHHHDHGHEHEGGHHHHHGGKAGHVH
ncbi:hypothetical protein EA187_00595 [Lujinxingia sediminis]|uniref:Polymerase/histidinol phosphatase N-terminal domain-containing protein n=1 Tax=Lujinxingia sediminis TaxID=2480984 RepID=A0ABY0CVT5_9DELT|nr:CehA/McbA family metallohydrolase [Lujinxingia sediminis]RVU47966.1 hypothetical protein EA187_00595 [Lujinxingia sediminis]